MYVCVCAHARTRARQETGILLNGTHDRFISDVLTKCVTGGEYGTCNYGRHVCVCRRRCRGEEKRWPTHEESTSCERHVLNPSAAIASRVQKRGVSLSLAKAKGSPVCQN